jgi:hypothetical protein
LIPRIIQKYCFIWVSFALRSFEIPKWNVRLKRKLRRRNAIDLAFRWRGNILDSSLVGYFILLKVILTFEGEIVDKRT